MPDEPELTGSKQQDSPFSVRLPPDQLTLLVVLRRRSGLRSKAAVVKLALQLLIELDERGTVDRADMERLIEGME